MISVFAAPTIVGTLFCFIGWVYLTYKNIADRRLAFTAGCFLATCAYGVAFYQYILLFYIIKTPQNNRVMWLLFIREICHCATVLIFAYNYKFSLRNNGNV